MKVWREEVWETGVAGNVRLESIKVRWSPIIFQSDNKGLLEGQKLVACRQISVLNFFKQPGSD